MELLSVLENLNLPFAALLGIRYLTATLERVTADMLVRDDLCTRPAALHGGAVMAFADTLGACATVLNLPEGKSTTTIESKTNFWRLHPWALESRVNALPCIVESARWFGRPASLRKTEGWWPW